MTEAQFSEIKYSNTARARDKEIKYPNYITKLTDMIDENPIPVHTVDDFQTTDTRLEHYQRIARSELPETSDSSEIDSCNEIDGKMEVDSSDKIDGKMEVDEQFPATNQTKITTFFKQKSLTLRSQPATLR